MTRVDPVGPQLGGGPTTWVANTEASCLHAVEARYAERRRVELIELYGQDHNLEQHIRPICRVSTLSLMWVRDPSNIPRCRKCCSKTDTEPGKGGARCRVTRATS